MLGAEAVSAFTARGRVPARVLARAAGLPPALIASIPEGAEAGGPEHLVLARRGREAGHAPLENVPADLEMLVAGLRPAVLLHGPEPWVAGLCDWAVRRGLTALPSAWAFRPRADAALGGYANLAVARWPAQAASDEWRALAISPAPALAGLLWLAEARGWDETMGLALGYPACCTRAFLRDWPEAVRSHGGDPGVMRLGPEGAEIPWELNIFARYAGPVLTEHFPCDWGCAASVARARRIAEGLARLAPALADAIESRMRCDITLGPGGWTAGALAAGARVRITTRVPERID
jgi:hypothetical protein